MNASGYSFTASGCLFPHPDTPVSTVSIFTIFCAISCLIRCDSSYSFLVHIIMLIGLISKHYIEFLIIFIEFYFDYSLLFTILSCRLSGYWKMAADALTCSSL